jgi:hypothetical protein
MAQGPRPRATMQEGGARRCQAAVGLDPAEDEDWGAGRGRLLDRGQAGDRDRPGKEGSGQVPEGIASARSAGRSWHTSTEGPACGSCVRNAVYR